MEIWWLICRRGDQSGLERDGKGGRLILLVLPVRQFDILRECCVICARLVELEWLVGWLLVWEYECEIEMEGVGGRWRKTLLYAGNGMLRWLRKSE